MIIEGGNKVLKLFRKDDINVKTSIVNSEEKFNQKLKTALGLAITSTFSKKFLVNITILKYNRNFFCKRISSYGISVVNNIFENYYEKEIQAIRIDIRNKDYPKRSYILFKL